MSPRCYPGHGEPEGMRFKTKLWSSPAVLTESAARYAGVSRRKAQKRLWSPTSSTKRPAQLAAEIGGWDINANVSSESDIQMLVDEVLKTLRTDRPVLFQRRRRSGGRLFRARSRLAALLGSECDGPRLCGARGFAWHAGAPRRISAADRVGRGAAHNARLRAILRYQTRGAGTGRVAQHHLRRSGNQGFRAVSAWA